MCWVPVLVETVATTVEEETDHPNWRTRKILSYY